MFKRLRLHARAFILGIREFRLDWTTHYDDCDLLDSYDTGRDLAHRLTLRRYDNNREA